MIDEKTSLLEAFHLTNELIAQGVRGIWRLLSRPGLINIDFADLCAVTQGKHSESSLATAEAKGENRLREVLEKLISHPLLDGGQALTEAAAVLVSIAGGPEMARRLALVSSTASAQTCSSERRRAAAQAGPDR